MTAVSFPTAPGTAVECEQEELHFIFPKSVLSANQITNLNDKIKLEGKLEKKKYIYARAVQPVNK